MFFSSLLNRKKTIATLSTVAIFTVGFYVVIASSGQGNLFFRANHDAEVRFADKVYFVGPRGNVPENAPKKKDFKLFAVPVPGVLSRSAQPSLADFLWLKNNGWKSVVDFREDGEKGNQYSIDSKLPGFNELGLNFLSIPIKDGGVPTNEQADQFLKFVTDSHNQPVHVHCASGIGRTGIAVALYRYGVESWPMEKAIQEASLFNKEIGDSQKKWLNQWASEHRPGSYLK